MTYGELAVLRHHLKIGYETGVFDEDFDVRWDVSDNIEVLEDVLGTFDKEMEKLQEDHAWVVEIPQEDGDPIEQEAFGVSGVGPCVVGPQQQLLSATNPDPENPVPISGPVRDDQVQFAPDPETADQYWEEWEALTGREPEDFSEEDLHKRTREEIKEAAVITEEAVERGFNQSVLNPMIITGDDE